MPKVPLIPCRGCGRDIPYPFIDHHRLIQCMKCGKKMHVINIKPVEQGNSASNL